MSRRIISQAELMALILRLMDISLFQLMACMVFMCTHCYGIIKNIAIDSDLEILYYESFIIPI